MRFISTINSGRYNSLGILSILFMRFSPTSLRNLFITLLIAFNSLYEILAKDSWVSEDALTFNSLYEILAYLNFARALIRAKLSILFMRFNRLIYNSHETGLFDLSILFMRFKVC